MFVAADETSLDSPALESELQDIKMEYTEHAAIKEVDNKGIMEHSFMFIYTRDTNPQYHLLALMFHPLSCPISAVINFKYQMK